MKYLLVLAILVFLTAGCTTTPPTISTGGTGSAIASAPSLVVGKTVGDDLQAAGRNFDKAIAIGVLPANDPAATCVNAVLKQTAPVAAQSFTPENDGLVSAGSIAYIIAQQARGAAGLQLPPECQAFVGKLVIDGARDASKLVPGLRLVR